MMKKIIGKKQEDVVSQDRKGRKVSIGDYVKINRAYRQWLKGYVIDIDYYIKVRIEESDTYTSLIGQTRNVGYWEIEKMMRGKR